MYRTHIDTGIKVAPSFDVDWLKNEIIEMNRPNSKDKSPVKPNSFHEVAFLEAGGFTLLKGTRILETMISKP